MEDPGLYQELHRTLKGVGPGLWLAGVGQVTHIPVGHCECVVATSYCTVLVHRLFPKARGGPA
jgi:hypothetical protein